MRLKFTIAFSAFILVLVAVVSIIQNAHDGHEDINNMTSPECKNPNNNAEIIFNRLLAETDLNAMQVAGILGNLKQESAGTLSPFVHEYTQTFENGGWGIAQWTGNRRNNDESFGDYIGVVKYSKDIIPAEVFSKYYHDYGKIAYDCTPDDVPEEVNEKFLNAQIDFLVRELTYRPLGFYTTYNKLKAADSIDEASDIWLMYFEVPSNAESLKESRRILAHEMFEFYGKQ